MGTVDAVIETAETHLINQLERDLEVFGLHTMLE